MRREQLMLREFHEKVGAVINDKPSKIDFETSQLRYTLIREELEELATALYKRNIKDTADAIGDLLYVVLGTAVSCGIDIEPIFDEIHRSNMSKFIDGHKREDGKWIKGPSYSPANLGPILEAQGKA